MVIYKKILINNFIVELVSLEEEQAFQLFSAINMDRSTLARWMPWTSSTNTVEDEINFIKYAKKADPENWGLLFLLLKSTLLNLNENNWSSSHNPDFVKLSLMRTFMRTFLP